MTNSGVLAAQIKDLAPVDLLGGGFCQAIPRAYGVRMQPRLLEARILQPLSNRGHLYCPPQVPWS